MQKKEIEEIIKKLEQNLAEVSDEQLFELMAKERGMSEKDIFTAHFIFWLIYDVEARLKKLAIDAMTKNKEGRACDEIKEFVEYTFEEMTFTGKINLVEKYLKKEGSIKRFPKLFSVLREFNNLRNRLFHQRTDIESLKYKERSINERKTKNQMILDITKGFLGEGQ